MGRLYDKILGCLVGVAVGDALGMPTHDMHPTQILERFGGIVESFMPPFEDNWPHAGMCAGQVTDDTGLTITVAKCILRTGGNLSANALAEDMVAWATSTSALDKRFIGPTFRSAILALQNGADPITVGKSGDRPRSGATNGAAMRVSPVGLIHPGDVEGAIKDAIITCLPTHATQVAVAGACAIAAGIAAALSDDADVWSVVRATMVGAERGELESYQMTRVVPAPSILERIKWAVSLVACSSDAEEAVRLLRDHIGTGVDACESVPTAIGVFLAAQGQPHTSVVLGANIGGDTDTIASMAGALGGALKGISAIPRVLYDKVEDVNHLGLGGLARQLEDLVDRRNRRALTQHVR